MRFGTLILLGSMLASTNAWAQAERYLPGHHGTVFGLAFTSDSKSLVSASGKETLVWDTTTWKQKANWGLASNLIAVNPTADTFYFSGPNIGVAAPSGDQLSVGPMLSGTDAATLMYHVQTRDNLRLGVGDKGGVVYVVDPAQKKVLVKFDAHPKTPILAIAFSNDNKLIATSGGDKQTKVWDATTGALIKAMTPSKTPTRALSFSADGKRLAGCTNEAESEVWDVATGTATPWGLGCMAVEFSGDGKYLATAVDGVLLFDAQTLQLVRRFGRASHKAVRFSPDSRYLVASSGDAGDLRVFDVAQITAPNAEKTPELAHGFAAEVSHVQFSPNGKLLVATGNDYWETQSRASVTRVFNAQTLAVERLLGAGSVAQRTDGSGNVLAIDKELSLLDPATGKAKKTFKLPEGFPGDVSPFQTDLSADDKLLVGLSKANKAIVWDLAKAKVVATVDSGECAAVAFAPSGKIFGVACDDGSVKLYNAAGKELQNIAGHSKKQFAITFSKNSKLVASGGSDGAVRVDDVASGKNVLEAAGEKLGVTSIAFDAKAENIVFGGISAFVHVWNLKKKAVVFSTQEHSEDLTRQMPGQVNDVAFSPDGKLVASASSDSSILVWDAKSGKVVRSVSAFRPDYIKSSLSMAKKGQDKADLTHTENNLFIAAENNDLALLKIVVNLKPNMDIQDEGKTPLITAIIRAKGKPEMVNALLDAGASPEVDDDSFTPLLIAASIKDLDVAKALLAHKANPDRNNSAGISALVFAIQGHNNPLVEALLAAKADPGFKGGKGITPLMQATVFNNLAAVKALLAAKADPNTLDDDGHSALHYSNVDKPKKGTAADAKEIAALLAAAGAKNI